MRLDASQQSLKKPREIVEDILWQLKIEKKTDVHIYQEYPTGWFAKVGILDDLVLIVTLVHKQINIDVKHCHGFTEKDNMITGDCCYLMYDDPTSIVIHVQCEFKKGSRYFNLPNIFNCRFDNI